MSYHLSQRGLLVFGPQRSEVGPQAGTCLVSLPWCHWCACFPQRPRYYLLPAASLEQPPGSTTNTVKHQDDTVKHTKTAITCQNISYFTFDRVISSEARAIILFILGAVISSMLELTISSIVWRTTTLWITTNYRRNKRKRIYLSVYNLCLCEPSGASYCRKQD